MSDVNDDETLDGLGAERLEHEDMAQEIEALKAEVAALNDKALRVAADAENTKRRAERDANDARAYAIQKFAKDLLDAADNLSRAVQHAPKDSTDPQVKTLITGVEMTEKAIQGAFERNGLKRLDPARGDKFDPNQHQAMMEQADADLPPGSVTMVAQPGYELYGRMLRPAMVAVTPKAPAQPAPKPATDGYAAAPAGETGEAVDRKA
jgi:molecular chaperone GrpE